MFIGWEEEVREQLEQELRGRIVEEVWSRWKEVIAAAEKGIGKGYRAIDRRMWRC